MSQTQLHPSWDKGQYKCLCGHSSKAQRELLQHVLRAHYHQPDLAQLVLSPAQYRLYKQERQQWMN